MTSSDWRLNLFHYICNKEYQRMEKGIAGRFLMHIKRGEKNYERISKTVS